MSGGDEEATGWVNQALFSDQPRLFKDDDNAALMEDYTWTHFSGDQSMPDSADGRTVQQGGLAQLPRHLLLLPLLAARRNALRWNVLYT